MVSGDSLWIQKLTIYTYDRPAKNDWMKGLPDTIGIGAVNIPGTHDAAAINPSWHTFYACHHATIKQQIEGGVRLLDIRLKVKKSWWNTYWFATCHGDMGTNEYEPFLNVMKTCKEFIDAHPKEFLVISLKVDDWNGYEGEKNSILKELVSVLSPYPVYKQGTTAMIPKVSEVRGKFIFLNRITEDTRFGIPVFWSDATEGEVANATLDIYVQDKYTGLKKRRIRPHWSRTPFLKRRGMRWY